MAQPSTTPEQQRIARYKHDPKFARELDARFAHQHKQSESELSNGSHANETDIIDAKPSGGPGSNGYFLLWLCPFLFVGCILLTNIVLGL